MKVFVALLCVALVAAATAEPEPQFKDLVNKAKAALKKFADKGLEKAAQLQDKMEEKLAQLQDIVNKNLGADSDIAKAISNQIEQAKGKVSGVDLDQLKEKVDQILTEQQQE